VKRTVTALPSLVLAPGFTASAAFAQPASASALSAAATSSRNPPPLYHHTPPPLCAAAAVNVGAATDRHAYSPGQPVVMTSFITNISKAACSVWLGLDPGFSPSFVVTNSAGHEVWDRCWYHDQPGACFMILVGKTLYPGQTYATTAVWDQRSSTNGKPAARVPAGTYRFTTHYQYIYKNAVRTFKISPAR
jgi:hypothetical protein